MSDRLLRFGIVLIVMFLFIWISNFFTIGDYYQHGKILFKNKQYEKAIKSFEKVVQKKSYIKDYALYYLAESYFQLKDNKNAEENFKKLTKEYPKNPFIEKAEFRIVQIALEKGEKLSVQQQFIQAVGIYEERNYGPASVKFEELIRSTSVPISMKGEVYHYLALCQYFLRKYTSATYNFGKAIQIGSSYQTKSLWWQAMSYQKLLAYKTAINLYQYVYTKYPKSDLAPQALVAIAKIYTELKQYNYANIYYEKLRNNYPESNLSGESYWQEAWNNYLKNDYQGACNLFTEGCKKLPNNIYSEALYFWAGKSARKINKPELAENYFRKAIITYDHNYYVYRSAQALGIKLKAIKNKEVSLNKIGNYWGRKYSTLLKQKAFDDAWLEVKERILTADVQVKAQTYMELAQAAYETGYILDNLEFIEKFLHLKTISVKELPLAFWQQYYPRPFLREITVATRKYSLEKELLLALIREESKFTKDIVSNAGAYGLMQLMPATAKSLLKGQEFEHEKLYEARFNVDLGAKYLKGLLKQFNNNKILALAAYNAGPHRVNAWLKKVPFTDEDEWIEQIPYGETRNYVKRVLRSYWEYQRLY
ncbi:MAG: transglycosylase SLT domain-containing protein [Candidatus Margulisbacteria bacterium]|nr:transglycosylase SLT domain-containing protein [Candidatus Margulisiibacteriota bacterium]